MWNLSSPTRDGTYVPCIGRQILNHRTTREIPENPYILIQCLSPGETGKLCRVWVEHVGGSEAVVSSVTNTHHLRPSGCDATIAKHIQSEEQYQE